MNIKANKEEMLAIGNGFVSLLQRINRLSPKGSTAAKLNELERRIQAVDNGGKPSFSIKAGVRGNELIISFVMKEGEVFNACSPINDSSLSFAVSRNELEK